VISLHDLIMCGLSKAQWLFDNRILRHGLHAVGSGPGLVSGHASRNEGGCKTGACLLAVWMGRFRGWIGWDERDGLVEMTTRTE